MRTYRYILLLLIASVHGHSANSTNLKILYTEFVFQSVVDAKARVILTWDNAWFNERNHDAIWVTFRFVNTKGGSRPIKVQPGGHTIINNPSNIAGTIRSSREGMGVLIEPTKPYRGTIFWTVDIMLDMQSAKGLRLDENSLMAFGTEMVFIPEGSFSVGDPSPVALNNGSIYKSDGQGEPAGHFSISMESQTIQIGKEKDNLFYKVQNPEYQGDSKGVIPPAYPKGVQAFYIMKYELRQGEYASFLTSLDTVQIKNRRIDLSPNYYSNRGSIQHKSGKFQADAPDRPCNYILWDDAMAFADWSGMRPMTELEYEKACRGTTKPVNGQYPWVSTSKDKLMRQVTPDDNLTMLNNWDESKLENDRLEIFGASYYWVMDLAGSLWDRCVTIGDEKGRAFTGTHGDGVLDSQGRANIDEWPSGIETSGYGYRGGGYYSHGRNYHDLNPHSPIGYRRYAAWSGGERTNAYGIRFVVTVPK